MLTRQAVRLSGRRPRNRAGLFGSDKRGCRERPGCDTVARPITRETQTETSSGELAPPCPPQHSCLLPHKLCSDGPEAQGFRLLALRSSTRALSPEDSRLVGSKPSCS